MEEERALCDPGLIDLFFYEFENVLKLGILSAFIINMNKVGFSEWVDTNDTHVIVPIDCEKDSIEIPVTRASKKSSMISGNYANGSYINPGLYIECKNIT